MATISITIPDAVLPRVVEALCTANGYDPSSGLTKNQFAKQSIARYVKQTVIDYETNAAANTAAMTQRTSSTTDMVIT